MSWKSLVQQCKKKVSLDENQDFKIEASVIKIFIFQGEYPIISIAILATTTNSTNDHSKCMPSSLKGIGDYKTRTRWG